MKVRTNYGELDLETIDGKTRLVQLKAAALQVNPPIVQRDVSGGTVYESALNGTVLASEGFDSKLEAKRARHWALLVLAGEIRRYKYHPFTVSIGPKRTYTPDFLVEYPDRRLVIEEVKGSLKMKNARDSVTRAHAAAGLLPSFSWRLVLGDDMEERWIAEA